MARKKVSRAVKKVAPKKVVPVKQYPVHNSRSRMLPFPIEAPGEIIDRLEIIAKKRNCSVEEVILFAIDKEVQFDFLHPKWGMQDGLVPDTALTEVPLTTQTRVRQFYEQNLAELKARLKTQGVKPLSDDLSPLTTKEQQFDAGK